MSGKERSPVGGVGRREGGGRRVRVRKKKWGGRVIKKKEGGGRRGREDRAEEGGGLVQPECHHTTLACSFLSASIGCLIGRRMYA